MTCAQAGGSEPAGTGRFPWTPATDVERQRHRHQRQHGDRDQVGQWRGVVHRAGGDDEHQQVPGDRDHRQRKGGGHGAPAGQEEADLGAERTHLRRACNDEDHRDQHQSQDKRRSRVTNHQLLERPPQRGVAEQDHRTEQEQGYLPGGTFVHDSPYAAGDISGCPAVPHTAVGVTEDSGRKHGVEQERTVVLRDRGAEAQVQAGPARDQTPAGGTTARRQQADTDGESDLCGPDPPKSLGERLPTDLGAEQDDDHPGQQRPDGQVRADGHGRFPGSASRSL